MFRSATPNSLKLSHSLNYDTGHLVLSGTIKKLLGNTQVKVDNWISHAPKIRMGLSCLQALAESEEVTPDGTRLVEMADYEIRIHPRCLANLDAGTADALQLPATTNLALDLQSDHLMTDSQFVVRSRWVRPGGSAIRAKVVGAILEYEGIQRRIPEPLFSLWTSASLLSEPADESQRFGALASLQALLPEQARSSFEANGYLTETRIHYASAFSLKLGRADPFDFDPVLFGPPSKQYADESLVPDEEDSVLPPKAQRMFAEDQFRRNREVKPAYTLRDGDYVYIDPALRPVLQEVRNLQSAPSSERRAFVTNPRRVLRQRLGEEVAERIGVDSLFLETEQFSARVAGVDVWTKPVLPWLKQTTNSWLPEKFGIRVGESYVELTPEIVEPLCAAVETAIANQEPTASVESTIVPATAQTLAALNDLKPFAQAAGANVSEVASDQTRTVEITRDRLFLVVRENFEEVEFAPFAPTVFVEPSEFALPDRLNTTLKPHQVDGLKWLVETAARRRSGVLLADDMGLGKTLQAIAFMAWLQEQAGANKRPRGPFLVVAPTGLLANWRAEIERHLNAPHLGEIVLAFGGSLKGLREEDSFGERDIVTGRAALQAEAWKSAGVVLTTYETLRDYHISFAKWPFELVIFDEIQKLKNPTSQLTRAAKSLNPKFVLGMTGTPVENRLQDLWSIMDVISPSLLGSSKDFERRYPPTNTDALKQLRSKLVDRQDNMPSYMLRRMKSDHLEGMPEKIVHAKQIKMPPLQASTYENCVRRAVAGKASLSRKDGILQILHEMRGISLHPIDPEEAPTDLDAYAAQSARLSWTLEILKEVQAKSEKALIFVESLAMQAKLATLIQTRFNLRHPPARIHGGVPGSKRQAIVNNFQSQQGIFDVLLLSPKAGGVGLTITAANHVIHLSRWWNPAVEDQSTDRAYRIGQDKPVHVYLPLAVHSDPIIGPSSFDIRLNDLLERKRSLSRDMLVPPEGDEADIGTLFEEVSTFESKGSSSNSNPTDVETSPTSSRRRKDEEGKSQKSQSRERPLLSLQNIPLRLQPRIWRCAPNQPRPLPDILDIFNGTKIGHLEISDPYAIADSGARSSQVAFVKALLERAKSIEQVTIEYRPPRDDSAESESDQRRDLGTRWSTILGDAAQKTPLTLKPRRKTPMRDFHDRFVFLNCVRVGGAIARHELQLGKGLIALMQINHECSITYLPPEE